MFYRNSWAASGEGPLWSRWGRGCCKCSNYGTLLCPSWEQETPAFVHRAPAAQRPPSCTCKSGDAAARSAGGGLQLLLPGCPESGPRVREITPCGGPAAFAGDQEPLGTGGLTLASDSLGFLPPPGRWCGSWLRGPLAEGRNCSQPWVVARPPSWKVPGCPGARKVPASWAGHVRGWAGGRCSGTLAGWEGHWPGHTGATTFAAAGALLLSEPARVPLGPSELGWPREMLALRLSLESVARRGKRCLASEHVLPLQ